MLRSLLILLAFTCILGCQHRGQHKAAPPPVPHVTAPLQAPVHAIDRELASGTKISIAGIMLCSAAAIILALEVHAFVSEALAGLAGSVASFAVLSALRLALPLLAMVLPWALAGALVLGASALWLWYRKRHPPVCIVPPPQ